MESVSPGVAKFGVAVQRGPVEELGLTRMKVDPASTLADLYAEVRQCTAFEAKEKISRIEGYTAYDMLKMVRMAHGDLDDTVGETREEGIRCVKFFEIWDGKAKLQSSNDGELHELMHHAERIHGR